MEGGNAECGSGHGRIPMPLGPFIGISISSDTIMKQDFRFGAKDNDA